MRDAELCNVSYGGTCAAQASVADLQAAVHKARPKLYPARQRFTLPKKDGEKKPVALAAGKRLADYDLADGTELTFKDLGPQARCSVAPCKSRGLRCE